jgi:hypothetical protein
MKAEPHKQSQLAVIAPLVPLLVAPLLSVQLQPRLPTATERGLAVALTVAALALVIVLVLRALKLRPVAPRKLGPAALAVVLGALATVGVLATGLMD